MVEREMFYLTADVINGVSQIEKNEVEGELLENEDFYDALATTQQEIFGVVNQKVYNKIKKEYGIC